MSEFEDRLWFEVVREHGHELERTGRTVHQHGRATRPRLIAGTTVGLAASATAALLLLGASTSPPAFAVTRNPNGTVTLNLMKVSGIARANEKLAAIGVPARVVVVAKSAPKLVCPGGSAATITFDPASVPKGRVLMITPGQSSAGDAAALKANPSSGHTVGSGSGAAALPDGGNHVVRTYSAGGKVRTSSGGGNHVVRMYCR